MDLSLLEDLERASILQVLRRDKLLRTMEDDRIKRMKLQLQELRRRGTKNESREYGEWTCARCQTPLGKFCNRGAVCRGCSHRICSRCRVSVREVGWKCTVCYAYREVKIRSGDWFLEEKSKKIPATTGLFAFMNQFFDSNDSTTERTMEDCFLCCTGKYETVGEKLLNSFNVLSHIAIVAPTPPASSGFDFVGRSENSNKVSVFPKSMEDLFSFTDNFRKMSLSQNNVTTDLLNINQHLYYSTQKSLSDTDISNSVKLYHGPSLPNLFNRSKDSEQEGCSTGAEEETSNSSENSEGKQGSYSSISTEFSLLEGISAGGDVELALAYKTHTSCLEITVGACRNLPHGDTGKKRCHPYVKLYMMPPKSDKRKTTVKRNTVHPVYNELFQFHIERHLLTLKRLQASVWHSGSLHRKVFLGEVLIPLDGFQFEDQDFQHFNWYPLCPQLSVNVQRGALYN
ncbi:synaptotagmin-like protein 3 isoform X2 [Syngnathus typhle]|uniref:synaptotagmin-like protein 3 isoform X2 n=1 Tax=Syngnathus typhle TaxID=161592 RepID=UPI002A6A3CBF|nr:synaptotagmin-like protein 3 isoform X2 [Syngnathus typhle]